MESDPVYKLETLTLLKAQKTIMTETDSHMK